MLNDEKLEFLTDELTMFSNFMSVVADNVDGGKHRFNVIALSKDITEFHDKYADKYNENQLVYQFLTRHLGSKDVIKLYNAFKKLRENGEIPMPTRLRKRA